MGPLLSSPVGTSFPELWRQRAVRFRGYLAERMNFDLVRLMRQRRGIFAVRLLSQEWSR